MTQLSYTVPTVGQSDTTEEPLIPTALTAIKTAINGNLDSGNIKSNAGIPFSALENVTSGRLIIGNSSNIAEARAMSGDATINNAGVLTIGNNAITTAKIINDAVTTAKILDSNVTNAKLATDAVTQSKMANDSVGTAEILAGNVTNAKLSSTAVQTDANIVRPTLHNDGSAAGNASGGSYSTTGATFTAAESGMHLIVAAGRVEAGDTTGQTTIWSRIFVAGVAIGVELKFSGQFANADDAVSFTNVELAALTSGQVVDFRIKSDAAALSASSWTTNEFVIKAACLTK